MLEPKGRSAAQAAISRAVPKARGSRAMISLPIALPFVVLVFASLVAMLGLRRTSLLVWLTAVALMLLPGTGAYGSAVLGYHFYTWALAGFVVLIAFAGVMLFIEAQFVEGVRDVRPSPGAQALGWLFILGAFANAVSTLLECGLRACPDNPTEYELMMK
jgi:hypothetical protein